MGLKDLIAIAKGKEPAALVLKAGRVVNVFSNEIYPADVAIQEGKIVGLGEYEGKREIDLKGQYIAPGFIDGHIHIESSMVQVPEFAKAVVSKGTTTVVVDPHEIANVLGSEGILYMLKSSKWQCPPCRGNSRIV